MVSKNQHACALQLGQTGILIEGKSGSGKTSLMMGLLEKAKLENIGSFLISDDQVILSAKSGTLEAKVPNTIAGSVEIRGYGIVPYPNKAETTIDLIVKIIEDGDVERMPDSKSCLHHEINLPLLEVPRRHENQAVRIVFAWLAENADLQVV